MWHKLFTEFSRKIISDHSETDINRVVRTEAGRSEPYITLDVKRRRWELRITLTNITVDKGDGQ